MALTVFLLAGSFDSPVNGDYSMLFQLGGEVTLGNVVVPLIYDNHGSTDANVLDGVNKLDLALNGTAPPMRVFGHDLGACVVSRWLHDKGPTSAISAANLSFVCTGNHARRYGGIQRNYGTFFDNNLVPVGTPYSVVDITRQYDGYSDYPNNPSFTAAYATALSNTFVGQRRTHSDYRGVSYNACVAGTHPRFIEGNVKYVWVKTYPLPMLGRSTLEPVATNYIETFMAGVTNADQVGVYPNPLLPTTQSGGLAFMPPVPTHTHESDVDSHWRPIVEQGYSRPTLSPTL